MSAMKPGRAHKLLILCLVAVFTGAVGLQAQDTKRQESRKAQLQKEIAILNRQISDNARQSQSALTNLNLLRKKISSRRELISENELEIRNLDKRITAKRDSIARLQARLDTMSIYYRKLIRGAYKNRDSRLWYMYILASDSPGQAFRRFGYLRNLSSRMNEQATRLKDSQAELTEEKERLEALKAEAEALRSQQQDELAQLQTEESDSKTVVAQLKKDKSKYQSQLKQKQRQVEALNREIQRIIQEAMQKAEKAESGKSASSSSSKKSTAKPKDAIDYTLAKSFASNKGKLPWPADGPVVESYGQHYHPVYKNVLMPFCYGVSIALDPGTQVKAVFDGTVKQVVVQPGFNQCVLVQHGDYFTFYCKLGSVSVKAGDKVKTGQVLGTVDTIAGETQLHFQLWSGKNPQNPESWLR